MLHNKSALEKERKMNLDEMQAQCEDIMNSLLRESNELDRLLTGEGSKVVLRLPGIR